ncbi:MAG TPA: DUF3150 domain-containing protein [Verrucomicrobiota bacterium]|nr:DUF3150 domain-containing protein [Verrucomicrobiota bacterium]HQB17538.1 DUF3150 domain-containing protein [Verrucomicrobiota bacterium]
MHPLLPILTREGVLLNVSVRYWRAHKKLRAEDLGLAPDQVSERLISLGHKRLLPKEATAALALVESRAHALVEANTFPFLNGLAHFVPNAKLGEVTAKLKALETEFWRAKNQFIAQYGPLRDAALEEWRVLAGNLADDPARVVAAIEAAFPPAPTLERKFGFDTQLFQIAVPERLGLDLLTLGDQEHLIQARQQAAREAAAKIREQTQRFIAECVTSLRQQTAQLCDDMLHSIRTGASGVHQKTLNRLIRFIDQFKQMNFVGDAEMEQQLETVRRELLTRTAEDYRAGGSSARATLESGLARLADTARELARQDATELVQRFGGLGRRKFQLAA